MIARLLRALTGRHHTVLVTTPYLMDLPAKMMPADVQRAEDEAFVFGNKVARHLRELGYSPGSPTTATHADRMRVTMSVRLGQDDPEQLIVALGDALGTLRTAVHVFDEEMS